RDRNALGAIVYGPSHRSPHLQHVSPVRSASCRAIGEPADRPQNHYTMKRSVLIACGSILSASVLQAQTIIYQENFDTYTAGAYVAQTAGDPWTTWSNAPGTAEDVMISDEQANSAPNSMLVATGTPAGGPGDMVLKLGNRTEGVFGLSWMMYIPSGFGGYFNLQHNETIGSGSWMIDVTFRADGTV